ncbi:hypothetical protein HaLaN_31108 [Haematococcus lacustris]|uniref:Uncharacterized protein n=1 Tax=Haematococcus lacustris TaxID=44745 RepID=A0A6A0AH31_HAELA|nr:hypothetical protein HaLaN_31108 [Haematococcus lacustris]
MLGPIPPGRPPLACRACVQLRPDLLLRSWRGEASWVGMKRSQGSGGLGPGVGCTFQTGTFPAAITVKAGRRIMNCQFCAAPCVGSLRVYKTERRCLDVWAVSCVGGECWAQALKLLAVRFPGCCVGPVGACGGPLLGTTSGPSLAGHAAGSRLGALGGGAPALLGASSLQLEVRHYLKLTLRLDYQQDVTRGE